MHKAWGLFWLFVLSEIVFFQLKLFDYPRVKAKLLFLADYNQITSPLEDWVKLNSLFLVWYIQTKTQKDQPPARLTCTTSSTSYDTRLILGLKVQSKFTDCREIEVKHKEKKKRRVQTAASDHLVYFNSNCVSWRPEFQAAGFLLLRVKMHQTDITEQNFASVLLFISTLFMFLLLYPLKSAVKHVSYRL